ncbi:calcium-binding protein [Shinella sp.]|uniref:calcium-binding protein n=1 Tax=Shinella sp. TaxID=1870904 RepID=UPI0029A24751|nr:calcium-binding protein [Shinella sp.]MDX3976590.1 calcium-binding protein [Shinella sp.]
MVKITGTSKANTLKGQSTSDDIYGYAGNDKLFGFGGNDDLEGGAGNDWLQGGTGNDELTGGSGRDTFVFSSGRDEIDDFSSRDDTIIIDSALGVKNFTELKALAKSVDGGEDVRFDFGNGNTLTLDDTKLSSLKSSDFSFRSVNTDEPKDPRSGNDVLNGNSKANTISGGDGNDKISGFGGNDKLSGDAGNDRLYGGAGHDDLEGGSGNDILSGGSGNDDLEGGSGNDRLNGGSGNNELEGGAGRDTFVFTTGKTEIEDFRADFDTIEIAKSLGVSSFADLTDIARTADGGKDVVFDFGRSELRLEDTKLADLSASDFLFV